MKEPFFSIVIPCYNCEATMGRLKTSLDSQLYRDFEIIWVDDCSEHIHVGEFIRQMTEMDPQNRGLKTPANGGPGVTRQLGLDNARGSYVMFIDSDDMLASPLTLGQIVGALQFHNFPDILATVFHEVHPDGVSPREADSTGWVHGKIYKREYLQKNDIRFPAWRRTEDGAFNYLAFSLTQSVVYAKELDTYLWMYREDSIVRSGDYTADMIPDYCQGYIRAYEILRDRKIPGAVGFAIRGIIYVYLYHQALVSRKVASRKIKENERAIAKALIKMEIPQHINAVKSFKDWVDLVAIPIQDQMVRMRNQEPDLILSEGFPAWVARLAHKRVKSGWVEEKK